MNRAHLLGLGFTYPGDARNHNAILNAEDLRAAALEGSGDCIISAEGLQNVPAATVRDWLHGLDVRVIVFLRDQAETFASAYQQAVKADLETCTFAEFIARLGVVDYRPFLRQWRVEFGSVTALAYDKSDIIPRFLSAIGIHDHGPFLLSEPDPNPSIRGDLLEAKRRLNAEWRDSAAVLRAQTYGALRLLANSHPEWRGSVLDDATALAIRAAHADVNHALAHEFGVVLDHAPYRTSTT